MDDGLLPSLNFLPTLAAVDVERSRVGVTGSA